MNVAKGVTNLVGSKAYPPKPFRILKFYEVLFDSVYSVLGKEKMNFTYALMDMKMDIAVNVIQSLPAYNKYELMQYIIDYVKERVNDVYELQEQVHLNNRFHELSKLAPNLFDQPRGTIMFRISPKYVNFLDGFKKNKYYAETIEYIIAYFVIDQEKIMYDYIQITFQYLIKNLEK